MWKDVAFCIIIIFVIAAVDFFIQEYIKNSAEEMTIKLNNLKQEVWNKEEDRINEIETKEVREIWEERYKILASIIEHNELEKVENNLTQLYSAIENKEQAEANMKIDESIFTLRHIKDKYNFKIENVF